MQGLPDPSRAGKGSEHPTDAVGKLLAVSRRLAETGDLAEVLSTVIDALRDLLDAERATVFEYDASTDQLFTQVAHGLGGKDGPGVIRIPANRGIAGAVRRVTVRHRLDARVVFL
jgi:GAF domain-containing protein